MKNLNRCLAGLMLLLITLPCLSQIRNIVYDGSVGIWYYFLYHDTLNVSKPVRGSSAWEAGLDWNDQILAINRCKDPDPGGGGGQ